MASPPEPTTQPDWATDALADIVEPSSGKKGTGWASSERPPAQEFNWWQNLAGKWIDFLRHGEHVRHMNFFDGFGSLTNWDITASVGELRSTGAADWFVPLTFKEGTRIKKIEYNQFGDGVAILTINVTARLDTSATAETLVAAGITTPAAAYSVANVQFDNKDSGVLTISVDSGAKTFTRSAGSFATDGFRAGMRIQPSGFSNAGNNAEKIISTVSGAVITVTSGAGLVTEAGDANERITSSGTVIQDDRSYYIQVNAGATGLRVGNFHVTYDHPIATV